jgi:hypothetical protein
MHIHTYVGLRSEVLSIFDFFYDVLEDSRGNYQPGPSHEGKTIGTTVRKPKESSCTSAVAMNFALQASNA